MNTLGDVGAGHTVGRYELLVPIAQGGMAVVWAARMRGTRGFQKIVAVKSMLPSLSEDVQFEEMFLAEAELASRIRHPNVCEILDLGEQDGRLYLVMEWVDGEPLSALQKALRNKGGFPIAVAVRLAMDAALGLHAAHELKNDDGELVGLVHRDVSPQNVLVTYDGVVKIVDFGVAKATGGAEQSKTRAGQVKGKVPFMSPEQALGREVDRRTDVFALGICLYQMIASKHPFRGDNDMATIHRICDKAPVPPPSTVQPKCPPSLDAVVSRALEKDSSKRFATMAEMAKALERVSAELAAAGEEAELGPFVRSALADRAERRRAAIKEALRMADDRRDRPASADTSGAFSSVSGRDPFAQSSPSAVSEISHVSIPSNVNPPISGVTGVPQVGQPSGRTSMPNVAVSTASFVVSESVAETTFVGSGRRRRAAVGLAVVLAAAAVASFLVLTNKSGAPADAPAPAGAGPASSPVEPATPSPSAQATSAERAHAVETRSAATAPAPSASPKASGKAKPAPAVVRPKPRASVDSSPSNNVPKVRDPGF